MKPKLTQPEIEERLKKIPGWEVQDGGLFRIFKFSSFRDAFAFMTKGALLSEKLNHHPDWSNSFKTVTVSLKTHDAAGITDLDFEWASKVSAGLGEA